MSSNLSSESPTPARICLVISTLSKPGGAERVVALLANAWHSSGVHVTVMTMDPPDSDPFFELAPGIELLRLNVAGHSRHKLQGLFRNIRQMTAIRRAVLAVKPDAVISFIDVLNATVVIACIGTGIPVIVGDVTAPQHAPIGQTWRMLRDLSYRLADRLVVQTRGAADFFRRIAGNRLSIIPNPVPQRVVNRSCGRSRAIAIGRFTREKGFDVLIHAFGRVQADFPEWTLSIFGDGPMRPDLEALIRNKQLAGRVFLPGVTSNVPGELDAADIFVLSSHFEGFPNVLCEAMASGIACIATDCNYGPRDIISDGSDGLLVPVGDDEALAGALRRLMTSDEQRSQLGLNASRSIQRFAPDIVIGMWNDVIMSVNRK